MGTDAESSSCARHVSKELGIAKEDVICHVTLLVGIWAQVEARYAAEAAVCPKKWGGQ